MREIQELHEYRLTVECYEFATKNQKNSTGPCPSHLCRSLASDSYRQAIVSYRIVSYTRVTTVAVALFST